MSSILCIETSSRNCSVSISEKKKLLAFFEEIEEGYCHNEKLHVLIDRVIKKCKYDFGMINAVAVGLGPGSYTGLRIGSASSKGISFSLDIPVIGVGTHETLLRGFMRNQNKMLNFDIYFTVIDSRIGEVYISKYDSLGNEKIKPMACVVKEFPFLRHIKNKRVCFVGNGLQKIKDFLGSQKNVRYYETLPSSQYMNEIAYDKFLKNDFIDSAYFEPLYMKQFIPS